MLDEQRPWTGSTCKSLACPSVRECAVAAVVRYAGTGKDTGEALDLPVVHVWDVRNGKLAQFRQFMDTAKFREVATA